MRTQIEFQTKTNLCFLSTRARLQSSIRLLAEIRFLMSRGSVSAASRLFFFPFLIREDKLRCLLLVFIGIRRLRIKLIFIRWSFLDPGGKLFWQTNNIFGPQKKAFGASEAFNWIENKFLTKICWLMLAIFCQMFCNDFFQLLFFSAGRWKSDLMSAP